MNALSTGTGTPTPTAAYCRAGESHDIEAVINTLAPGVILRSPISDKVEFHGHDEVRALLVSVFATIAGIHYIADVGDARTRALFYRANVNGQPLEEAALVELDETGLITEITLFFRPLPGLATLTAALVPRIARKHGRFRSLVGRLLLGPLGLATRLGDRLANWLT